MHDGEPAKSLCRERDHGVGVGMVRTAPSGRLRRVQRNRKRCFTALSICGLPNMWRRCVFILYWGSRFRQLVFVLFPCALLPARLRTPRTVTASFI